MTTSSPLPADEDARESLANLIAEERDQYPRRPDDMDSEELAVAVLAWMEREGFRRSVVSTPSDEVRALVNWARERVGEDYSIIHHGEVGEPSNGALLLRLAAALEASVVSTPPSEDWEYGVGWYAENHSNVLGFRATSEEDARTHVELTNSYPDEDDRTEHFVVRRTPERSAGPWEPVPAVPVLPTEPEVKS